MTRGLSSIVVLAILGFVGYQVMSTSDRDAVNDLASRSGTLGRVVPWPDRAETAIRRLMDGPSGQAVASSVLDITHGTGKSPRLLAYDVRRFADQLSVRISVGWQGGFTGDDYQTTVVWEFDEQRHLAATILADTAVTGVTAEEARRLDEYFRVECYAVLHANAGN